MDRRRQAGAQRPTDEAGRRTARRPRRSESADADEDDVAADGGDADEDDLGDDADDEDFDLSESEED
jgi:hypothetical protein